MVLGLVWRLYSRIADRSYWAGLWPFWTCGARRRLQRHSRARPFRAPGLREPYVRVRLSWLPVGAAIAVLAISALTSSPIIASGVVLSATALMRSQSAERLSTKTTCPECFAKKPFFPLPDICFGHTMFERRRDTMTMTSMLYI